MNIALFFIESNCHFKEDSGDCCWQIAEHFRQLYSMVYVFASYRRSLPVVAKKKNMVILRPVNFLLYLISLPLQNNRNKVLKYLALGPVLLLNNLFSFIKLARIHRKINFSTVAVHDWKSYPVGLLSALLLRIPVAYNIQSTKFSIITKGHRHRTSLMTTFFE